MTDEANDTVKEKWNIFQRAIPYLIIPSEFRDSILEEMKKLDEYDRCEDYENFKKQAENLKHMLLFSHPYEDYIHSFIGAYKEKDTNLEARIKALETELKELKSATNVTSVTNICQHCGEKFETLRKHTQYCSNGCKQAAYRKRKEAKQ